MECAFNSISSLAKSLSMDPLGEIRTTLSISSQNFVNNWFKSATSSVRSAFSSASICMECVWITMMQSLVAMIKFSYQQKNLGLSYLNNTIGSGSQTF